MPPWPSAARTAHVISYNIVKCKGKNANVHENTYHDVPKNKDRSMLRHHKISLHLRTSWYVKSYVGDGKVCVIYENIVSNSHFHSRSASTLSMHRLTLGETLTVVIWCHHKKRECYSRPYWRQVGITTIL